jgi:hypothetical protein
LILGSLLSDCIGLGLGIGYKGVETGIEKVVELGYRGRGIGSVVSYIGDCRGRGTGSGYISYRGGFGDAETYIVIGSLIMTNPHRY